MESEKNSIISNDLSYKIINNNISVFIQVTKDNQIIGENSFSIEELKNFSPYFHMFISIEEIVKDLNSFAQEDKLLLKESNNSLLLLITLSSKSLSLPMKKISLNYQINNEESIQGSITLLQKQVKMNSVQLINLENKVCGLLDKINLRLDKMESTLNEHFFNLNNNDNIPPPLKIKTIGFLNEEETVLLTQWVSLKNEKPIQFKLLYNPTQGNDTIFEGMKSFYTIPSILILIKTDKGAKFGGYTSVGFGIPKQKGRFSLFDYFRISQF